MTETVRAELYKHGPFTFAFLVPAPPLDIFGLAELNRRTQIASQDTQFGTVQLRTIDDPDRLDIQVLAILPSADNIAREPFEELIRQLFVERNVAIEWHTNINEADLVIALFIQNWLKNEY
ncbi:MAG TPA: hypothetical protein VFT59_02110 [Candidatus Saccharimonadales bacterium]|nr:hypothetical protein [Candidatus Saccharimonadales bacterium]